MDYRSYISARNGKKRIFEIECTEDNKDKFSLGYFSKNLNLFYILKTKQIIMLVRKVSSIYWKVFICEYSCKTIIALIWLIGPVIWVLIMSKILIYDSKRNEIYHQ